MTQYEIETRESTVKSVTHEVVTGLSFPTDENQVKVAIFDKEFYLNYASIQTVWEDGGYIPEAYIKVSYVSILKNGKTGQAYDKREFNIGHIGKYIVGAEDTFKEIFKKHAEAIESKIKEQAAA
jgi:hypothetical protein